MSTKFVQHRLGGWLPKDQTVLESWLAKKIAQVEHPSRRDQPLLPVIQDFQKFIEGNPVVYMGFHEMFEQVPHKPPYDKDPTGQCQVRNYKLMLKLFDQIIREAPSFEQNDLVGFPINAILDWPMGTDAGLRTFVMPEVNEHFHKMFDVWSTFLTSKESCYVLTNEENGWFGPCASIVMPDFVQTFVCDPDAPYYGFTSWDDFFTRLFRPGVRPFEFADNDNVINSACESTVYKIQHDVKEHDRFWLKGEPYSLEHMLGGDELTSQFVGGTICQAFLSATKYHRWHSPVKGTIKKIVNIPGTYYAESPATGFKDPDGPDPAGPNNSQAFITAIAARALVFIEADNPKIGLMGFLAVGMAEVSTCEVTVKEGQKVAKGDEIGMFHFGGSTHCLIFRPQTNVTFVPEYSLQADVLLGAAIATVE